jgi:aminoglycoside phosphotransferase (APT) family kinase protein
LKFLEPTAVPAPKAFGYGTRGGGGGGGKTDHGVGVGFILMEELPGKPWNYGGIFEAEATKHERDKLWNGLADVLAELAKYPLPKAGSLRPSPKGGLEVGPVASDRFKVLDPFGPFERAIDYYTAWAEQYLTLIADGQLYAEHPIDAYLVYRFLKENAWQLVQDGDDQGIETTPASKKKKQQQFFLKHVDDVGHHLLVDDDLNITGIIDWQMARAVPPREAFGPSLVTVDCRYNDPRAGWADSP